MGLGLCLEFCVGLWSQILIHGDHQLIAGSQRSHHYVSPVGVAALIPLLL